MAAAKAAGLKVLVTDHHLAGSELPDADAIVNPNQPGCEFPSKALAGVGVIFYVLMALRRHLRDAGVIVGAGPDLASLLDLVAVGTVADLVPLDANNRALVAAGLPLLLTILGLVATAGAREVTGGEAMRDAMAIAERDPMHKAGARAFPQLVPVEDDKDGVADNIAAWQGLAGFDKPFLTLFGEDDPVLGQTAPLLTRRIKGAAGQPHAMLSKCGHFSQEDRPNELAQGVIDMARQAGFLT